MISFVTLSTTTGLSKQEPNVLMDSMEDLKQLLIKRLNSQGLEPDDFPLLLRDLTTLLASDSDIGTEALNARLNVLGWHKAKLDYQSLQLALAWIETGVAGSSTGHETKRATPN
jgi:hypothetical protein